MKFRCRTAVLVTVSVVASFFSEAVPAFGPYGHLIVGLAAEPHLCDQARSEIASLTEERFVELGFWADRIRDRRPGSGRWHFINVADDGADFRSSGSDNVLWAIRHFSERLRDDRLPRASRAEALKFLVHFIADIHQPLHVGRAEDAGGNLIEVRYGDVSVNLHRFWDNDAIRLSGLAPGPYAVGLRAAVAAEMALDTGDPMIWARESFALRREVYEFSLSSGRLNRDYLNDARAIVEKRLAKAAARMAKSLNEIFCGNER